MFSRKYELGCEVREGLGFGELGLMVKLAR